MKLLVLSDLHIEFGDFEPASNLDHDVVVLAGDIDTKGRAGAWATRTFKDKPVILVLGNHDFYGSNLVKAVEHVRAATAGTNVHFLHNESVVIDGVRFLGGTLWTDYRITGNHPLASWDAQQTMTDHRKIRTGTYSRAMPRHLEQEHMKTRSFFNEALGEPFDGLTVVVTHHAPTAASIHPRFRSQTGSHLNAAYASSLEHMMGPHVPLWIHGHMHDSVDVEIAGTRVICNPRGYVGEELNAAFKPDLVVEV